MICVCIFLFNFFFFFNDTATTEIYTLSLHDALPISPGTAFRPTSSPWRSGGTCGSVSPTGTSKSSWPNGHRGRPREHLPVGPAVRAGVRRGRQSPPARRGGSLARGRDLSQGEWDLALLVPCDRPVGHVIDVYLSPRRNTEAARRFFAQALDRTRTSPVEVTTDRYRASPRVLDELLPAAFHGTEVHANNPLEADHGRLKSRLRPMRGLKRDRAARVIVAGHAFVQNLRRGFYDLGTDVRPAFRLADAFSELALVI